MSLTIRKVFQPPGQGGPSHTSYEALYAVGDGDGLPLFVRLRGYRNDPNGNGTGNFSDTTTLKIVDPTSFEPADDEENLALVLELVTRHQKHGATELRIDNTSGNGRIDIGSKFSNPAAQLSNFAPHDFIFSCVHCASMEGLLQSFKFEDPAWQMQVCALHGFNAWKAGTEGNGWKVNQTLWWQGQAFKRDSKEYQALLDRAFFSLMACNKEFRHALVETGKKDLVHSVGKSDPRDTILTEEEFCSRLTRLRQWLTEGKEFHIHLDAEALMAETEDAQVAG